MEAKWEKIIQFCKKSWTNMSFHYMVPSSSTALIKGLFPMRKDISDYLGAKESHALPPIWPADIFLSASVLFDVICRATPPRSACTPYPPWRLMLRLLRLRQSLFQKVWVKLSSQVSMSPPSSVNKKRFAARVCGLLPKFEVAVLAFEKKSQPRRWRRTGCCGALRSGQTTSRT